MEPKVFTCPREVESAIKKLVRLRARCIEYDTAFVPVSPAEKEALSDQIHYVFFSLFGEDSIEGYNVRWGALDKSDSAERICLTINWLIEQLNDRLEELSDEEVLAVQQFFGLKLHPRITAAVKTRLETKHYHDAVNAAINELNELIREKTGEALDGVELTEKVIGGQILNFNTADTKTGKNEKTGLQKMFTGIEHFVRNTTSHDKSYFNDQNTALECIAMISLMAKKLDQAVKVPESVS